MMQRAKDKIQEQLSRIGQLLIEPVESQNDVQHFAEKIVSILENTISLLCVLILLILVVALLLPYLLSWLWEDLKIRHINEIGDTIFKIRQLPILLIAALILFLSLTRHALSIVLLIKSYYLGPLLGSIFFLIVLVKILGALFTGVAPSVILENYIKDILARLYPTQAV